MLNEEPFVFRHECPPKQKGQLMTESEKREFLVRNLLDIYGRCGMSAHRCAKPSLSLFDRLRGKTVPAFYPDIAIDNFHGVTGQTAYYIVLPGGTAMSFDMEQLPEHIKNSYLKIIYGYVFSLEEQKPDLYKKGYSFVAQYKSKAVLPFQTNNPLPETLNAKDLASLYATAWKSFDASILQDYLDKDFHYSSDCVFDDMSSRDEYLDYLTGKFNTIRTAKSIKSVRVGRKGEPGLWPVTITQILDNGELDSATFLVRSRDGRILSVSVQQMDSPMLPAKKQQPGKTYDGTLEPSVF